MIMRDAQKVTVSSSVFFTSLVKVSSFLKVSFIVGSWTAFFSATSIATPLVGAFTGIGGTIVVFALSMIVRLLISGTMPFIFLAYHIPGLCASAYFASSSLAIRMGVPLLSMALFIAHPVGGQAWAYTLYWLIPVALYLARKDSLFITALGSTFTAHAVGSVIWLYANPMTPGAWLALIPVVLVERLVFASGMVALYYVLVSAKTLYTKNSAAIHSFAKKQPL